MTRHCKRMTTASSRRGSPSLEVAPLSAENRETIMRTHSSYFDGDRMDELLPA